MLGMLLAVFAMAAQADAAAMLFRVNNVGAAAGNFAGSTMVGETFWLKLDVVANPATAPTSTVTSSFTGTSRLYRVGNWADDAAWGVNLGSSSVSFLDAGALTQQLAFNVTFTNGQKLNFLYSTAIGGGSLSQSNATDVKNMYKFINSLGNPNAGIAGSSSSGFSGAGVKAIPEPGSMAVLGLLSSGLGYVAVRRRKTAKKM